ncbi:ABC transporter ATP-binding protein [Thalassospira sp.]|uniref:ABC transporter ATP-binding protein n=1 Tax=Thalassospira sp. TaxID=1912094 RepID=UPI0027342454|nr:ABC transporter ATP-binding protein [Thalassospira sp.]MDP2697056.1 ABC transporter ATP-binding protein [Thalassospira sp.]
MTQKTRIELRHCAKTFADGTQALEPFDLTIEGGETIVLLGPSGCGKTTALRLIAGLEYPDAGGQILFDRDDVTRLPIEDRRVGMVFQSYALFPNMTVAQNVAYGLKVLKINRDDRDRRVMRMLEMMHIDNLAHRRIDQLSGGQRQRVALARAIAVEPRVLLLDEPLTALDAKLRTRLRTEINSLLRQLGITAIYVTHDQEEAMALGDRIVVMQKGRIAQIGTPRDIYGHPQNAFVAGFIGTTNCLPATFAQGTLHVGEFRVALEPQGGDGMAPGDVDVFFRPDTMALSEQHDAHFSGIVESAAYLGDRTRLSVAGIGDALMTVDADAERDVRIGEAVHLRIDRDKLMIFPRRA